MKSLVVDTETSGLDPKNCAIVQLHAVLVEAGLPDREFSVKMRPHEGAKVEAAALKVQQVTFDEIQSWDPPHVAFAEFERWVNSHGQKFHFVAYNAPFDKGFLDAAAAMYFGNKWMWQKFWWPAIDVAAFASRIIWNKRYTMPDFKLMTVYQHVFGAPFEGAHTAAADARATAKLWRHFAKLPLP